MKKKFRFRAVDIDVNKEILRLLCIIVIGLLVFWGFRTLGTNVSGSFNFFKYVMNPEYFEQHSKDLDKQFEKLDALDTKISNNYEAIKILQSYQTAQTDVEAFTPQVKILRVTRVASNFHTTPANYTKEIEYGKIEEKGSGEKKDKYTVISFDDGTWMKVTTGKMTSLVVGDKVKKITSKVIKKKNYSYVAEETTSYELCIN